MSDQVSPVLVGEAHFRVSVLVASRGATGSSLSTRPAPPAHPICRQLHWIDPEEHKEVVGEVEKKFHHRSHDVKQLGLQGASPFSTASVSRAEGARQRDGLVVQTIAICLQKFYFHQAILACHGTQGIISPVGEVSTLIL